MRFIENPNPPIAALQALWIAIAGFLGLEYIREMPLPSSELFEMYLCLLSVSRVLQ